MNQIIEAHQVEKSDENMGRQFHTWNSEIGDGQFS